MIARPFVFSSIARSIAPSIAPSIARSIVAASVVVVGCSAGAGHEAATRDDASIVDGRGSDSSTLDLGTSNDGSLDASKDGGGGPKSCAADSLDMQGCTCPTSGATRPCFTGDKSNRNVGACKDGTQTCTKSGELAAWGACTGDVVPQREVCTDTLDHDCNGIAGCKDPSCAKDPACASACKDGDTRPCYDGPPGTLGVGICKAGTQTCKGGAWDPTCAGEVLPEKHVCSDMIDHECNHLPGCLNLFACILDPACQPKCKSPLDPGCVCPEGTGDTATCPKGDKAIALPPPTLTIECCPCAKSDCGDANCCGETICKGDPKCGSVTCRDLPPSCGGKVSADCDDFPEDCDEPCCECYGSCSGP